MIYYTYIRVKDKWELLLETYNEDDYTPVSMNGLDEFSVVFSVEITDHLKELYNRIIKAGYDPSLRSVRSDKWMVAISDKDVDIYLKTNPHNTVKEALEEGVKLFEDALLHNS